jgi:NAD+ diphosphatase
MPARKLYIFRSGELYISNDSTLFEELPPEYSDAVLDSFDLPVAGEPVRAILLKPVDSAGTASSAGNEPSSSGRWIRLRTILASDEPALAALAAPACRALGYVNWHDATRFCAKCGKPLEDHAKELARFCPSCGTLVFPRISPAIIVLVEKYGKILLARHSYRNQDMYSCIAGFLEHGETLEECVAREVFEETGLSVKNIRYAGSQSWPFPDQFMVAFYADWASGEIKVDPSEILEACWFDRAALPNHPMPGTVAWRLINNDFPTLYKK